MDFLQAIKTCFNKKYATFSGRARRKEFWYWVSFSTFIPLLFSQQDVDFSISSSDSAYLFLFLPSLAVAVRRLQDTGRTGWNLLWSFLPLIGWAILLAYYCEDSQKGDNKYGPNPKELSD